MWALFFGDNYFDPVRKVFDLISVSQLRVDEFLKANSLFPPIIKGVFAVTG